MPFFYEIIANIFFTSWLVLRFHFWWLILPMCSLSKKLTLTSSSVCQTSWSYFLFDVREFLGPVISLYWLLSFNSCGRIVITYFLFSKVVDLLLSVLKIWKNISIFPEMPGMTSLMETLCDILKISYTFTVRVLLKDTVWRQHDGDIESEKHTLNHEKHGPEN